MQASRVRRPSPALIVALIALVAALAGTATALPGKKTVDKNDIKKNAVKSKTIAEGAVKSSEIKDEAVGAADLTDPEAPQVVTALGNGGQGDCVWGLPISGSNPISFYKDPMGIVHLAGIALAADGPGGDANCSQGAGEFEDGFLFALPPGYRPDNVEIQGVESGSVLIAPDEGANVLGFGEAPPGMVVAAFFSGGEPPIAFLDGITFRAPGPATASDSDQRPARVPPRVFRTLRR